MRLVRIRGISVGMLPKHHIGRRGKPGRPGESGNRCGLRVPQPSFFCCSGETASCETSPGVAILSTMLTISADTLPRTDLTYLAFRAAWCETLERIVLAQQITLTGEWTFGYLTEVPFLRQVAPQVQLDLLLATWQRHISETPQPATLLDQSVVYSVCETAARMVRHDPGTLSRFLSKGPQSLRRKPNAQLARALQRLQLSTCHEGHFLLISQFLDLPPREARTLQGEFGIRPEDCDPLFDALGRWYLSSDFDANAAGLLTADELATARTILRPTIR